MVSIFIVSNHQCMNMKYTVIIRKNIYNLTFQLNFSALRDAWKFMIMMLYSPVDRVIKASATVPSNWLIGRSVISWFNSVQKKIELFSNGYYDCFSLWDLNGYLPSTSLSPSFSSRQMACVGMLCEAGTSVSIVPSISPEGASVGVPVQDYCLSGMIEADNLVKNGIGLEWYAAAISFINCDTGLDFDLRLEFLKFADASKLKSEFVGVIEGSTSISMESNVTEGI